VLKLRYLIALLVCVCIPTMGAAQSCGGPNGPARSASYAGDGITQFGAPNGKLKWGVTYSAHYTDTTDRQNCKWSLYTINSNGETTFIKRGNYLNAKVNVGEQRTKKVYLKSIECGLWKPK
jgi:hypothetical protein